MALFPEKKTKNIANEVGGEEPSALNIERKEVVTPIPTQFKAQVADDSGNPIIQTPQTKKVQITIPATSEEELQKNRKEKTTTTTSWNASFLLRVIQKALHFGKQVLFSPIKMQNEGGKAR